MSTIDVTSRGRTLAVLLPLLAAAALATRWVELLMLVGLVAATMIAAAASLYRAPEVDVRRTTAPLTYERGTAGATETIEVRSRARFRFLGTIELRDTRPSGRPEVIRVRGRSRQSHSLPVPTSARGVFTLGPLVIRRVSLFGLATRSAGLGGTTTLVVHPRVFPLDGTPTGITRDLDGRVTTAVPTRGSQAFLALREYVPGDDPRHIHWATSARSADGQLIVRDYVDPQSPRFAIVLDARASEYQTEEDAESAVDVATSIAIGLRRAGEVLTISDSDGRVELRAGQSELDLLEYFATLSSRGSGTPAVPPGAPDSTTAVAATAQGAAQLVPHRGRNVLCVPAATAMTERTSHRQTIVRGSAEEIARQWHRAW